MDPGRFEKWTG